jgi:hypothetical protein
MKIHIHSIVLFKFLIHVYCVFFSISVLSQNCNTSVTYPTTNECDFDPTDSYIVDLANPNITFTFDSFSKYKAGITLNGASILKLVVKNDDGVSKTGTCFWKLNMQVDNGPVIPATPATEWETRTSYGVGSSAPKPTLNILRMKIDNVCHTPYLAGQWRTPFSNDGDFAKIVDPTTPLSVEDVTACATGSEANGIPTPGSTANGSYLGPNYGKLNFVIDYRIIPDVVFAPGVYTISIKFCLTEQ